MKIILSSIKNEFWTKVVNNLSDHNIQTSYWVGEEFSSLTNPKCAMFNKVSNIIDSNNDAFSFSHSKQFDVNLLSTEDYYNYLKILDREDCLGGFSFSKRDRTLKDLLNFWYTTLSDIEPDAIIFSNVPHLQYDYPLYLVAKSMGLKTMMFNMTPYSNWCYATFKITNDAKGNLIKVSNKDTYKKSKFKETAVDPYEAQTYILPTYMKKQVEFDNKRNKKTEKIKELYRKSKEKMQEKSTNELKRHDFFTHIGESKLVSMIGNFYSRSAFHKRLKETHDQYSSSHSEIDSIKNYIYVPLHYQPEATTAPLGGIFSDQIYMIKHLRTLFPNDVSIVVKEHYSQFSGALKGYMGRDLDYWSALLKIENVYIAPLDYNQKELITNSIAVSTVTGTAGWEAIQFGKYCILFGSAWYSTHPNAINYKLLNSDTVANIISNTLLTSGNDAFLDTFCDSLLNINLHLKTEEHPKQSINDISTCIIDFLNSEYTYVN